MSDIDQRGAPTDQPGVVLRDHVYDGIQEYDQKLPNWWLFTLYIAIVVFVVYWVCYYQFGWFSSDHERIDAKMAVIEAKRESQLREMLATLDNKSLWEMSLDPARVDAGEEIYQVKCLACHGPDLSGFNNGGKLAGLPLNDKEWKHGGDPMDVFNSILDGVPAAGMIPWKTQMGSADIAKVAAFVLSHHKEGEEWTKAPDAPPAAPPPAQ